MSKEGGYLGRRYSYERRVSDSLVEQNFEQGDHQVRFAVDLPIAAPLYAVDQANDQIVRTYDVFMTLRSGTVVQVVDNGARVNSYVYRGAQDDVVSFRIVTHDPRRGDLVFED